MSTTTTRPTDHLIAITIKTHEIISQLIDAEGEVTEEIENQIRDLIDAASDRADWALTFQDSIELRIAQHVKQIKSLQATVAKLNRSYDWIKHTVWPSLLDAAESVTGEAKIRTALATVYYMTSEHIEAPADVNDWPDDLVATELLRKPQRTRALDELRSGREIPGFAIAEKRTAVVRRKAS